MRMLEAAAQSPIRLVLVAQEPPPEPSERLLRTVRRFGERLPALRAQFAKHLEAPAEAEAAEEPAEPEPPEPPDTSDEPAQDADEAEPSEAPAQAEAVEEPAEAEPPEPSDASDEPAQDSEVNQEVPEAGGEVEIA